MSECIPVGEISVMVDALDVSMVRDHHWYPHGARGAFARYIGTSPHNRCLYLHREIVGARAGQAVRFINGNVRDCRRENLAIIDLPDARRLPEIVGDGTARVPLTKGRFAVVDVGDLDIVGAHRWYYQPHGSKSASDGYARRRSGRGNIWLHRAILGVPDSVMVDHANRNPLDNRRCNLRIATRTMNTVNSFRLPGASGFRGVKRQSKSCRWIAQMRLSGKLTTFGSYATKEEAARAYDAAALRHFGEFAVLNFPHLHPGHPTNASLDGFQQPFVVALLQVPSPSRSVIQS